jgi:hypothetical protein
MAALPELPIPSWTAEFHSKHPHVHVHHAHSNTHSQHRDHHGHDNVHTTTTTTTTPNSLADHLWHDAWHWPWFVWALMGAICGLLLVVHLVGMYLAAVLALHLLRGWDVGVVGDAGRVLGGLQMKAAPMVF